MTESPHLRAIPRTATHSPPTLAATFHGLPFVTGIFALARGSSRVWTCSDGSAMEAVVSATLRPRGLTVGARDLMSDSRQDQRVDRSDRPGRCPRGSIFDQASPSRLPSKDAPSCCGRGCPQHDGAYPSGRRRWKRDCAPRLTAAPPTPEPDEALDPALGRTASERQSARRPRPSGARSPPGYIAAIASSSSAAGDGRAGATCACIAG